MGLSLSLSFSLYRFPILGSDIRGLLRATGGIDHSSSVSIAEPVREKALSRLREARALIYVVGPRHVPHQ